jgi:hypothetical protein
MDSGNYQGYTGFMEADQWNIKSVSEGAKEPDHPRGLDMIKLSWNRGQDHLSQGKR